jgi:hypothetical protein
MTPGDNTNAATPPNTSGTAGDVKPSNINENKRYRRCGFRKSATTPRPVIKQPKFEGKCEDLVGHIYDDCSDTRQSGVFVKITKEIAESVGRTFNLR